MVHISLNDGKDYVRYRTASGGTVEIVDIAVYSERMQGVGRKLVQRVLAVVPPTCKLVWAITRSTNEGAIAFYTALGFREIAKLHRFYKDDPNVGAIDAVMYGKDV